MTGMKEVSVSFPCPFSLPFCLSFIFPVITTLTLKKPTGAVSARPYSDKADYIFKLYSKSG